MGQRISFYKNNFKEDLKEIIFGNYDDFKKWYLDSEKTALEDFDEQYGTEELKTYLRKDADFRSEFQNLPQQLIDELTSEFISEYFDGTFQENNFLDFFGPTMSVWRYEESTKMVEATTDEEFLKLWNYLIKGRSLKNNFEFKGYTNEYKIGYLNKEEIIILKNKIITYFGNDVQIKEKYWTNTEKEQLELAIARSKDGSYSLLGHPKSSGLEYVLEAINCLTDNNIILITGIE